MKITKSQLKQLIKEELEATMGEGFLDKMAMAVTGKKLTKVIYIPGQSIIEVGLRGYPTADRARALIKLFAPKGTALDPDDLSEDRTISIQFNMYGDDDSKSHARIMQKLKNLKTQFMIADSSQPGGMDQIKAKDLAYEIYHDVRKIADQQDTDRFINKQDADSQRSATDDELGLPRNQGYQTNE